MQPTHISQLPQEVQRFSAYNGTDFLLLGIRGAEAAHQAKLGPAHTVLGHGVLAKPGEIHIAVDGVEKLIVSPDPLEHLPAVLVHVCGDKLMIVQVHGYGEGL